jgi:energy-coupling factor transport system ATP-binding protein
VIQVDNLTVRFGEISVLDDISLEITPGEFVLLTGPSGCGKTTLAQAICGLIPHALPAQIDGRVKIAGLDTQEHTLPELAQRVNLVFQNPASQLFHLTVQDEITFGPRNLGLLPGEVRARTEWALHATGLYGMQNRKVRELSGGQKQCLAIAANLAMRPAILVLDEPTASLDAPNSQRVVETLERLNSSLGITILVIEHRFAGFARIAQRCLIMDGGQVIADGDPERMLRDPKNRQTLGLRRMASDPGASWPALIHLNGSPCAGDKPLLTLEQISAGYDRKPVIQGIDLKIYPGEFVALVGNNGTGKSTLARVAAGLLRPFTGKVWFKNSRRPRPGLDVSILFQDPGEQLFTDRVEEEIGFGPRNYGVVNQPFLEEILCETGLEELRWRKPLALSAGQQQRTALGACLALQPKLIILDEPTLGQDWGHLQRLMDFLTRLNRNGMTILLISHDYKLVHHYADRVLLMEDGRISLQGVWNPQPEPVRKEATHEILYA